MSRLGLKLPASVASFSRSQCHQRHQFIGKVQENITTNAAYSYSKWMSRSFSSSSTASIRSTQEMAMASPRWINHSGGKGPKGAGAKGQGSPPASSGGATPPASGSSGSDSDGSAPPASSSGDGEDGDGKDDKPPAAAAESSSGSSSNESSTSDASSGSSTNSLTPTLPSQPPFHPTLLALPIARRPLFPGFYKAVVIKNPAVVSAIKEMMKRGQPYLGAFLLKDGEGDSDIITDVNEVHDVGVFAQITSVFGAASASGENKDGSEEGLTAVLYPHRRIRITELIKAGGVTQAKVDEAEPQTVTPPPSPTPSEGESQSAPLTPLSFLHTYPISIVNTVPLPTLPYNKDNQYIRAFTSEIVSVFKDIAQLNPLFRDQITNFSINQVASNVFDEPDRIADFAAAVSSGSSNELQEVLEATAVDIRLQKALLVLKKELINAQLQNKLSKDVDSKIAKRQREYYLMEQLKGIKKELGLESDGKDKLIEKFKTRAAQLNMPVAVRKVFDEELAKLTTLEPSASEANVTRTYLDWITQLPWGVYTPSVYSIKRAQRILDEDHYGLEDLKERILEFIAVGKLRGSLGSTRAVPTEEAETKPPSEDASSATVSSEDSEAKTSTSPTATVPHAPTAPEGKILLLVGPPGVGKTSVGKSLARAVGREFFRFSVGGLGDVAEIKGHRRTYVGALPGKIVQALKRVGTSNPLVLIDEIDKLGRGHNGDPSSALLEMLDPEQNREFLDHYLDVPIDLSRVLFVCTANNLSTIPAPLLDRMEVLEVAGYVSEEKAMIAERYLTPQAKEASGLKDADVILERDAVDMLIKWYCRESGVRNLKKHVEKIYRKAALKIVKDLGEDALPEPPLPADAAAEATASQSTDQASTPSETTIEPVIEPTDPEHDQKTHPTTTHERAPLQIPPSVHIRINSENLKDYVGPQVYQKDRMYEGPDRLPAGVSTGLGYLGNGSGAVMPIEAITTPGKGSLILTGKLGEVIRESAQIALSWVKSRAYDLRITKSPDEQFLVNRDVHIHMPEGSVGKEGPSAGTAILSALVSLGTGVGVRGDMAMTGEISLSGHVLPVGGLKEKILAAHRAGIKTILAPKANQADIEVNVPASVKEGIRLVYVEDVREVLEEVFRGEKVEVSVDAEGEGKEGRKVKEDMIERWGESVRMKRG